MIPPFDTHGYLPPGVHPASMADIELRFGTQSEIRRAQMESIRWMIDLARRAGARRIILNGSFVTDIIEPNDVDCVLLFESTEIQDFPAFEELIEGLPYLDIVPADAAEFQDYVDDVYASDRHGSRKGMIEIHDES